MIELLIILGIGYLLNGAMLLIAWLGIVKGFTVKRWLISQASAEGYEQMADEEDKK